MKFRIVGLLISGLLAVGCQSARVPAVLPAVQEYGHQPAFRAGPATTTPIAEPPQLLADASAATSAPARSRKLPPAPPLKPIRPADAQRRPPVAAPDTVLVRATAQTTGPDPETSRVNMLGGLFTAGGLITFLAASGDSSPGWDSLLLGLAGLALIPVGIALLLYQGKNGRLRLRRQARREARRAAKNPGGNSEAPVVTPPVKGNPHMRKVGSILLLISAALLLTGALLGGGYALIFLGLPGLILGISGLVAVVASL
ncbi:hypothetical protein HNQ93_000160 [Hymenobacter luteus]|uniref:Uncharacterized protein n=2 Tax=Hymenobacter TaxID=89966 RepID=A0A7W9SXS2_9BACT|nr:hypothetical protein [Hymenobacter latericoloratus]MBB6057330.1 hypothetical protein [Hymenobacter luteus]